MNFSALIFCIALVCVPIAACQEISPLSTATPFKVSTVIGYQSCEDQNIKSGADFVGKKAFFLSPTFDPTTMAHYQPPPMDPSSTVSGHDPYSTDLAWAWGNADPFFQEYLCGLTAVFIVKNPCSPCTLGDVINNSWGLREHPPQIPGNQVPGRYIATSQQLWQGISPKAPSLSTYETRRLQYLLKWTSRSKDGVDPPAFNTPSPDIPQMTVLAALSHEFGHVWWWDVFVTPPGGSTINPSNPSNCNAAFYSKSWQYGPAIPQGRKGRWVEFGDISNNNHLQDDVNMVRFFGALQAGNDFVTVGDLLHEIYSGKLPDGTVVNNGRWASGLAAYSTDEDFVETFQLLVLMTAKSPLKNLPIKIYGTYTYIDDVPAQLLAVKNDLLNKMACFGHIPS